MSECSVIKCGKEWLLCINFLCKKLQIIVISPPPPCQESLLFTTIRSSGGEVGRTVESCSRETRSNPGQISFNFPVENTKLFCN